MNDPATSARSREGEIAHAMQCCLASVALDQILTCHQPVGWSKYLRAVVFEESIVSK